MEQTPKVKYLHAKYSYFRYNKISKEVLDGFKKDQNFKKGLLFAILATVLVTIFNVAISNYLDRLLSFTILLTGYTIGHTMRYFGKGISFEFGLVSTLLALFSFFTSIYLSFVLFIAQDYNLSFIESITAYSLEDSITAITENIRTVQYALFLFVPFDAFRNSFRIFKKSELVGQNPDEAVGAEDLLDS